jgi:hypothetical protein
MFTGIIFSSAIRQRIHLQAIQFYGLTIEQKDPMKSSENTPAMRLSLIEGVRLRQASTSHPW